MSMIKILPCGFECFITAWFALDCIREIIKRNIYIPNNDLSSFVFIF
jgi:hypothetical protein